MPMQDGRDSKAASKSTREFTLQAVVLGCGLGVLMTAANTYLGLYAGMTVSASIPAAVIPDGRRRGHRRVTILGNLRVEASAGRGSGRSRVRRFHAPRQWLLPGASVQRPG